MPIKNDVKRISKRRLLPCLTAVCAALLLIAIPLAGIAADEAALTWEEYVKEVRELEHRCGSYTDWQVADKVKLIGALVDMDHIHASAATDWLFSGDMSNEDKSALADQIMLGFLGGDGNHSVSKDGAKAIQWDIITYAILGDSAVWTHEQRVWFQDVTNMYRESVDPDMYVLPNENDLPEADAVRLAKAAIISAKGLTADALDRFMPKTALLAATSTDASDGNERLWYVSFLYYEYGQADGRTLLQSYGATVDENGIVTIL